MKRQAQRASRPAARCPAAIKKKTLPVRGFLIHVSHYDPLWFASKDQEKPFDVNVALELIDAMAEAGLNLLAVDCADGVRYASHPELARPYTVPMAGLRRIARRAEARGIETVGKLNFSQSGLHRHNHWFRPYNDLFDSDEYFRKAFELIDEVIAELRPRRFFHIGMDEDHWRGHRLYVRAIKALRSGLKKRGLRTLIWNDSACVWPAAEAHKEKSLAAELAAPKDVVQVLWDYATTRPAILRRIVEEGFELWGAPGGSPDRVRKMRRALLRLGGKGILLTRWRPCTAQTRDDLLAFVRTCGPVCL